MIDSEPEQVADTSDDDLDIAAIQAHAGTATPGSWEYMGSGDDDCRIVDVDGDPIRVQASGDWTDEDHAAFAEIVRAAKAKFASDPESQGSNT